MTHNRVAGNEGGRTYFNQLPDAPRRPAAPRSDTRTDTESVVSRSIAAEYAKEFVPKAPIKADDVHRVVHEVVSDAGLNDEVAERAVHNLLYSESTFTRFLQAERRSGGLDKLARGLGKKRVNIRYDIPSELERSILAKDFPDFDLIFPVSGGVRHDHALAAARRLIEQEYLHQRFPTSVKSVSVGGNFLHYIYQADTREHVHICAPKVGDKKDAVRHPMRRLAVRTDLANGRYTARQAEYASMFLDGNSQVSCGLFAQHCSYQADIITSLHVYDIPLRVWGDIMLKKNARVVFGVMIFSRSIYTGEREGFLRSVGARYTVDFQRKRIRFGFTESPSWQYEHDLVDYLAYGREQLWADAAGNCFSYRISEQRGDTIFFEILRIPDVPVTSKQVTEHFLLPTLPVVKVEGFELSGKRSSREQLQRRDYVWPETLFKRLFIRATALLQRGRCDLVDLTEYYRTVSTRLTINGRVVLGFEPVPVAEVSALIVHVMLAAVAQDELVKREYYEVTQATMQARANARLSFFSKLVSVMTAAVPAAVRTIVEPAERFINWLVKDSPFDILDWHVVPEYQEIPIEYCLPVRESKPTSPVEVPPAVEPPVFPPSQQELSDLDFIAMVVDDDILRMLDREFKEQLPEEVRDVLGKRVSELDQKLEIEAQLSGDGVVVAARDAGAVRAIQAGSKVPVEVVAHRRLAIAEAISDCENTTRAVTYELSDMYDRCCIGGSFDTQRVSKFSAVFHQADAWHVNKGVLALRSVMGVPQERMQHSLAYKPSQRQSAGLYGFIDVPNDHGQSRRVLVDETFTGYLLVNDLTLMDNGPAVVASLHKALRKGGFDFAMTRCGGPPGCGKTRSIATAVTALDMVVAPARASTDDARSAIVHLKRFPDARNRISTIDSYLVNRDKPHKSTLSTKVLFVDEAFMCRSGMVYAVAALLDAVEVRCYGDDKQIPYVPRHDAQAIYAGYHEQEFVRQTDVYLTYRCPADVTACLSPYYDYKIRSHPRGAETLVLRSLKVVNDVADLVIKGRVHFLTMYQADKRAVRELFKVTDGGTATEQSVDGTVLTVHEAQGKTFENVILFRFDPKARKDSLFDRQSYVTVAMSRHTKSFQYFTPAGTDDLLQQLIRNHAAEEAVSIAADFATAGTSKKPSLKVNFAGTSASSVTLI